MSKRRPTDFGRPENLRLSAEDYFEPHVYGHQASQEFVTPPLKDNGVEFDRRDFLKWAGLTTVAFSMGCIRRPVQKIVPYNRQPEVVTLGKDVLYTSTWFDGFEGLPIVVRTREGRPLHFEGLAVPGLTRGGLPARAHADLWFLYDPERLRANRHHLFNKDRSKFDVLTASWEDVDKRLAQAMEKGRVALLTGPLGGLSERRVVADFCQAFKAQHWVWHPGHFGPFHEALEEVFGHESIPFFRFDQADLVVSVGADFLGGWLSPTIYAYQWSQRRQKGNPPRLVAIESVLSLTGSQADLRLPVKPSQVLPLLLGLLHDLVSQSSSGNLLGSQWMALLKPYASVAQDLGISEETWRALVKQIQQAAPRVLIVADHRAVATSQAKELYKVVLALNHVLGAFGVTISDNPQSLLMPIKDANLSDLAQRIEQKQVDVLIIRGCNPCWGHPEKERWKNLLKQVPLVVQVTTHLNETSLWAHYVLAESHPQESWNDLMVWDGIYHIHQPTIRPLFDTREFGFMLMSWAYEAGVGPKRLQEFESFYDYVKDTFASEVLPQLKGVPFEQAWNEALEQGYVKWKDFTEVRWVKKFKNDQQLQRLKLPHQPIKAAQSVWELVVYEKPHIRQGHWSNCPWIQELPDPVSKVAWGNYAGVSPLWAKARGIRSGQVVEIENNEGVKFRVPVYLMPGVPDQVVALALGYGHTEGSTASKGVGHDVTDLAVQAEGFWLLTGSFVHVRVMDKVQPLACVQDHHVMEGRTIAVTREWNGPIDKPVVEEHSQKFSLWPGHAYNGHKWAMVVDLDLCVGCGACMVACQAENNIPTVGPDKVREGREMHWIRVDRYFEGPIENPQAVYQPVMCQQCDHAPCETVCPVIATAHNDEGLNDMAYNRCVGTRYCANNCPYKVRRFNWFNYTKDIPQPLHLLLNPDVTVRHRGVMEKCTFCVHRIKAAKLEAKVESRELKDGDIVTACQQTCPTGAIVFGDLNDPNSQVSRWFRDLRAYELLQEWNVGSNVRYLVRWRRPIDEPKTKESAKGGGPS